MYHFILPEIEEILPWALMPNLLVQMLYLVFFCILFQEYISTLDKKYHIINQSSLCIN